MLGNQRFDDAALSYAAPEDGRFKQAVIRTVERLSGQNRAQRIYREVKRGPGPDTILGRGGAWVERACQLRCPAARSRAAHRAARRRRQPSVRRGRRPRPLSSGLAGAPRVQGGGDEHAVPRARGARLRAADQFRRDRRGRGHQRPLTPRGAGAAQGRRLSDHLSRRRCLHLARAVRPGGRRRLAPLHRAAGDGGARGRSAGPVRGAKQPPVPAGQPLQLHLAPVAPGARDPEPDRQRHPRTYRRGAAVRGLGRHERSEAARRPAAGVDLRHRPRACSPEICSKLSVGRRPSRRLPAWTIACSSRRVWRARTGSRPSRRQIRLIIGSSISSSSLGSPLRPKLHSLLAAIPDVCGLCSCRSACIPITPLARPRTRRTLAPSSIG